MRPLSGPSGPHFRQTFRQIPIFRLFRQIPIKIPQKPAVAFRAPRTLYEADDEMMMLRF